MKKVIKKIVRYVLAPLIFIDYLRFKRVNDRRFSIRLRDFYPCIKDKTIGTRFDAHYVYHTSWAARKVASLKPERHTDLSSSLFFCGIVSAFVPVDFYDYRPANLKLSNLTSGHADLTKLPFSDNSVPSLSCMHVVEHIGLGRYGEPFDADGDLRAIGELARVLAHRGTLLFVVPVGKPKIEFNAHRIYSYEQIVTYFKDLKLEEFSLVTDIGDFINNADSEIVTNQSYACGCFCFSKP